MGLTDLINHADNAVLTCYRNLTNAASRYGATQEGLETAAVMISSFGLRGAGTYLMYRAAEEGDINKIVGGAIAYSISVVNMVTELTIKMQKERFPAYFRLLELSASACCLGAALITDSVDRAIDQALAGTIVLGIISKQYLDKID